MGPGACVPPDVGREGISIIAAPTSNGVSLQAAIVIGVSLWNVAACQPENLVGKVHPC